MQMEKRHLNFEKKRRRKRTVDGKENVKCLLEILRGKKAEQKYRQKITKFLERVENIRLGTRLAFKHAKIDFINL